MNLSINTRIKQLRKELGISQSEFGARIGLKGGAISKIERAGSAVTDQNIHLICDKFGVNEKWLRTGEGSMYEESSKQDELVRWARELSDASEDTFPRRFALALSRLGEKEWEVLEKFIDGITLPNQDTTSSAQPDAPPTDEQQEAARRAEAHRLLDLELDAEKKEPSASLDTACIEKNKKRA